MTTPRRLPVVYAVVFIAFLDNFAMLPTVGPYARSLGADPVGVGIAVAAYSVTNLVFNLVGGVLLDRVGRKRVAIAGLAIAAGAVACYAFAGSLGGLIAARLLHGVGGGVLVPALFTLVGDLSEAGARGRAMGRAGAFIGAAAVAGPAVAGVLRSVFGFVAVFGGVTAVLLAGLLLAATLLRETVRPAADPLPAEPRTPRAQESQWESLALAVASVFAFTAAFGTLAAFLPDDVEQLGGSAAVAGGLFALVSGIAAVLMLSPVAQWVDRAGAAPPVRSGMTCFAGALLALAVGTPATVGVAAVTFGVGFGVLFPAATGAVAIATPQQGRGKAFGVFNAAYSLGFIVGAPAAGALASLTGLPPYLLPAAACVLVLAAAFGLTGRAGPER